MTGVSLAAVGVAWLLGLGLTAWAWPRTAPLPGLGWVALGGLLGPCAAGATSMALGAAGLGRQAPLLVTVTAIAAGVTGARRWRRLPAPVTGPGRVWLVLVLVAAIAGTASVARRTHLGWDGTVVWLHKARMLAASDGVMPASTLADATRSWTAPDYPLHVPAAMAWVLRWQQEEDERALKVLPAAWYAAILCLVAAVIRERAGATWPASLGVLLVASAPRLLVGEGSLTSGYADGPVAGLLAALLWMAGRSGWGEDSRWRPLLAIVAFSLAWTKQEGAVAVTIVAAICMWHTRAARAATFAIPAWSATILWQLWTSAHGSPTTMAYALTGVGVVLSRMPLVLREYAREMGAWSTWGVLWPALLLVVVARARRIDGREMTALVSILVAGASAFLFSAWPDVVAHLQVTAGRQLVQIVPAATILALGGALHLPNGKESPA